MHKSIIHIHWPSCSGKSTIFDKMRENIPGIFTVASDYLKWQINWYDSEIHKNLVKELTLSTLDTACNNWLLIILDSWIRTEKIYQQYLDIAAKYWYSFHDYLLTAPREILIGRFRERMERIKLTKLKTSVTDESVYIKNLDKGFYHPKWIKTFDTSAMSIEEVYGEIIGDIR